MEKNLLNVQYSFSLTWAVDYWLSCSCMNYVLIYKLNRNLILFIYICIH